MPARLGIGGAPLGGGAGILAASGASGLPVHFEEQPARRDGGNRRGVTVVRPVPASSVGGVPGHIESVMTGWLVPRWVRDVRASAMLRLLRNASCDEP